MTEKHFHPEDFYTFSTNSNNLSDKNQKHVVPLSSGETILIVDDEEAVRILCSTMVKRLDYSVITAEDGQKAIEIFQDNADNITCVVLDLTMPTMDGYAVCNAMKKMYEGCHAAI